MDQGGVLHDQGVGLGDRLVGADGPVVDPAVGDDGRPHPLRAEARERLGEPPLVEGGHRQDLGGGHDALPAPTVDPDLEHGLAPTGERARWPGARPPNAAARFTPAMPLLVPPGPGRPVGPMVVATGGGG